MRYRCGCNELRLPPVTDLIHTRPTQTNSTQTDPTQTAPTQTDAIRTALARGCTVAITTTGRTTGQPRRIEIVFHRIDGRIWISGMPSPRRRSWLANLADDPRLTLHLKGPI